MLHGVSFKAEKRMVLLLLPTLPALLRYLTLLKSLQQHLTKHTTGYAGGGQQQHWGRVQAVGGDVLAMCCVLAGLAVVKLRKQGAHKVTTQSLGHTQAGIRAARQAARQAAPQTERDTQLLNVKASSINACSSSSSSMEERGGA
jgi:hypothetical protein